MKRQVSEFYSDPSKNVPNRISVVSAADDFYVVDLYEYGILLQSRNMGRHNLQYAEDCAENWVLGVIK
jgi:hypothetical protein